MKPEHIETSKPSRFFTLFTRWSPMLTMGGIIAIFLIPSNPLVPRPDHVVTIFRVLGGICVLLAILCLKFAPQFVTIMRELFETDPVPQDEVIATQRRLSMKAHVIQTRLFVLESVSILGVMLYLLASDPIHLILPAIGWPILILAYPTSDRLEADYRRSLQPTKPHDVN